ncbi:pyruvate kinase [Flagellimonas sp.]|uniref:pyruvate kinase n=1 Tax=Flagellimonas sp. TaxID=2058762 RepID=UPI003B515AD2
MNIDPEKLPSIAKRLEDIIENCTANERDNEALLKEVCETYQESAKNLLHYSTFRTYDLRSIQKKLKRLGLSRFANAEGNILGSLTNAHNLLRLMGQPSKEYPSPVLGIGQGKKRLRKHTNALFPTPKKSRRVRIMVTQPTESAHDYNKVLEMVKNGMNCARINCAHDNPDTWKAIADNVRKAAAECGTDVKIAMDLAGPKIRTGSLGLGPKVLKFKPKRSVLGIVETPAQIRWLPEDKKGIDPTAVPVASDWLALLQVGDKFILKDTRGKKRKLVVHKLEEGEVLLHCKRTVYLETGTRLQPHRESIPEGVIGELPATEKYIELYTGNLLAVTANEEQGKLPQFDEEGKQIHAGSIPCLPSKVVSKAKKGEPILFDDGKIEGVITEVHKDHFMVRIVKAKENGARLKAEKGINFPTLDMGLSGLTDKDREDLKFVAKYADIVNFSFVNTAEDVDELLDQLEQLGARDKVSVILKIETRFAYRNLVKILLAAMKTQYVGVMIARGDLALEVGWKNMGKVQEEILSFCSAAHIPVVWATQVLEGLAKSGLPSRSEITDITSSLRAECVMLNKGPYINEAIVLLDEMLRGMEKLHSKKEGMWPKIDWL